MPRRTDEHGYRSGEGVCDEAGAEWRWIALLYVGSNAEICLVLVRASGGYPQNMAALF